MVFKNRIEAGEKLCEKLEKFSKKDCIVLGIPRGGVKIAHVIAKKFGFPLDLLLSKKIGHPMNPEYAIGAVELGGKVLNPDAIDIPKEYIEKESVEIQKKLKLQYNFFMGKSEPKPIEGKIAIIVDDGIATGLTISLAIDLVRKKNPKKIILAVPVAPKEALKLISKKVDEIICLLQPEEFYAIGQFYENFEQVSDEEVSILLKDANK